MSDSSDRDELAVTLDEAALVDEARDRAPRGLRGRDAVVTVAGAAVFLVACVVLPLAHDGSFETSWWRVALLVGLYACFARVEFEIGSGSLVPTQLALVPMLFLLPVQLVPAAVGVALLLGDSVDVARSRLHPTRILVGLYYGLHAVGPAVVLAVLGDPGPPGWHDWPLLAGALAAQFAVDGACVALREVWALGAAGAVLRHAVAQAWLLDALLSTVALLAVLEQAPGLGRVAALVPLALLLLLMAHERRRQVDGTIELSGAYVEAQRAAHTDPLTGVANRRAWEELVERYSDRRPGPRLSTIVVDVDGLKAVNDHYGHDVGDALIREVADTIRAAIGGHSKIVARIGGDEFACLFEGGPAICRALVTELREALAVHPGLPNVPVSASVGGATCPPQRSLAAAVEAADQEAYADKRRRGVARGAAA